MNWLASALPNESRPNCEISQMCNRIGRPELADDILERRLSIQDAFTELSEIALQEVELQSLDPFAVGEVPMPGCA